MIFLFLIAGFIIILFGIAILHKKMRYWILSDVKRDVTRIFEQKPKGTIHVIFCVANHFEPGNGYASPKEQRVRVNEWLEIYPRLASRHRDSDGVHPQHSFFFPPHYDTQDHLEKIVEICSLGFGEVEMHLHHDRQEPWPDNESTLRRKILNCLDAYSRFGIYCLPDGRRTYGFIHGDWALSNSLRNGAHCGINDELSILKETGCYADFTFPISNEAQPMLANTFFYGQSRSAYPKGYNVHRKVSTVGEPATKGLLLIQGIIGLRWKSRKHLLKPSIEQSNISSSDLPVPRRIDYWVKKGVHVERKPDWIFIKVHCHGASSVKEDRKVLLNLESDHMFEYLEDVYNDGKRFLLHYVSAREMYNIVRAAEDGKAGNPNDYRNYEIPRYIYLP